MCQVTGFCLKKNCLRNQRFRFGDLIKNEQGVRHTTRLFGTSFSKIIFLPLKINDFSAKRNKYKTDDWINSNRDLQVGVRGFDSVFDIYKNNFKDSPELQLF